MKKIKKIGIFGFGNMGQAIFKLLKNRRDFDFFVYSHKPKKLKEIHYLETLEGLLKKCDLIFICIKPQDFKSLFLHHKGISAQSKNKIVVSIMAGIKSNRIKQFFKNCRAIRTMPNLNLVIGEGVLGWHAKKKYFSPVELKEIEFIFSRFGKNFFVSNEDDLNSITAIAGSGPAYAALFTDSLIKAGIKTGLSENKTKKMVFKVLSGTIKYLQSNKIDPEKFIEKVTSKGGVTEAALNELNSKEFKKSWERAIKAAVKRAKELSG
ncbi:MAG: pyrroline-5-carboxylate reductase [Candidatus Moranbacteria bacterium]|nr:pyrroline-5-carboxylate reductase [Candidatus Moranbacteria bacterium]